MQYRPIFAFLQVSIGHVGLEGCLFRDASFSVCFVSLFSASIIDSLHFQSSDAIKCS
jgi:hypothetical protein